MDLECHEKLDSTPLKEDNISRSEDRCHEKLDTTPLKKNNISRSEHRCRKIIKRSLISYEEESNKTVKTLYKFTCKKYIKRIKNKTKGLIILGDIYYYGLLDERKNYKMSVNYYKKAIELGSKKNYDKIAQMYCYGDKHLKASTKDALTWFKKDAKNGSQKSMYLMGLTKEYLKKYEEAFNWYSKNEFDDRSLYKVAIMKLKGIGCDKNYEEGLDFLKQSKNQGNKDASNLLMEISPSYNFNSLKLKI